MSTEDIIEEIKALPPSEQEKVIAFTDELKERGSKSTDISDDEFKALVNKVFDKHGSLMQRLAQ